ncbi:MAG TPA: Glu/Leu/Phe/Val dehydrogenase dimerization domain-containing protein [Planctomycetota bacterium]|jgi:leucine dehydrogenase|nr:Glu/Leu/Phe/Val dehydrogenase dimerization domain-containing protein [Planctomycetota bacterium]
MEIQPVEVPGYERVVRVSDPDARLVAFIAIHDTTLGPALGGMRMWPFRTEEEAQTDALRLARGMTYKSAVADMALGGGKSVVLGDGRREKTEALFRSMGRAIDSLGGLYITAEDVGVNERDLEIVRRETRWVTGLASGSGNPSPFTARGALIGMKACAEEVFGSPSLKERRVAIHGVGAVGGALAQLLHAEGANLLVADLDAEKAEAVARETRAEVVSDEAIFEVPCDVFSPNALGGVLNDRTIPRLRCRIVAGCANNQLLDESRHGAALLERGICYAPDFVLNAGGIINVGCELLPGGYDRQESLRRIDRIGRHLREVFRIGRAERVSTAAAALRLAERRLAAGRRKRERGAAS